MIHRPPVLMIAGPNGAGKSTAAPCRVRDLRGQVVPEDVFRGRYQRGLANFCELYRLPADRRWLYDAAATASQRIIAAGGWNEDRLIGRPDLWQNLLEKHR